ncbi:hypothetical protein [Streptomyces chengbuensis]|uniref:hypothetical protein n=1 Tax=Streptomyces chengbuensis TaxID=3053466 RepID=UPI003F4CFBEC
MDETGFVKKGRASAGVQRQDPGTAGHPRVGAFLAYHQATVRRSHYRRRSADETAEAPDGIGVTGPGPDRARTRRALEAFGPRIEGPAG